MELLTGFEMLLYWPFDKVLGKGTDGIAESKCLDSAVKRGSNAIGLKPIRASFGLETVGCSVVCSSVICCSELSELVVDTVG